MQVKGVILLDYPLPASRITLLADLGKREVIDARSDKSPVGKPTGNDMGNPPVGQVLAGILGLYNSGLLVC